MERRASDGGIWGGELILALACSCRVDANRRFVFGVEGAVRSGVDGGELWRGRSGMSLPTKEERLKRELRDMDD
jgi:hypothetical protein